MDFFKDLYQYRELLKTNVHKDIRGRYKGSFLGILWTFLNPLLQVFVYYLVFPYLFRASLIPNFLCFLITGIIPWNLFITVVNGGTTVFKANGGIIKKVYFPREILLVSQVLSGIVNFLISCIIILIFCICTGAGISYHLILLPVLIAIEGLLSLGIIFILGSINVYVQDMENIVQFILNLLFYFAAFRFCCRLSHEGISLRSFSHMGIAVPVCLRRASNASSRYFISDTACMA